MHHKVVSISEAKISQGVIDEMYRDRKVQFRDRLGWDLFVDSEGREIDQYDIEDPFYIILVDESGQHVASTRIMPTCGPNMLADHFGDLTNGAVFKSPLIWEVTRFFVTPRAHRRAAATLMWAGCEFGRRIGVTAFVGVTAADMVRVFSACGWNSNVLGSGRSAEGPISVCRWDVTDEACEKLRKRARIGSAARIHCQSVAQTPAFGRATIMAA